MARLIAQAHAVHVGGHDFRHQHADVRVLLADVRPELLDPGRLEGLGALALVVDRTAVLPRAGVDGLQAVGALRALLDLLDGVERKLPGQPFLDHQLLRLALALHRTLLHLALRFRKLCLQLLDHLRLFGDLQRRLLALGLADLLTLFGQLRGQLFLAFQLDGIAQLFLLALEAFDFCFGFVQLLYLLGFLFQLGLHGLHLLGLRLLQLLFQRGFQRLLFLADPLPYPLRDLFLDGGLFLCQRFPFCLQDILLRLVFLPLLRQLVVVLLLQFFVELVVQDLVDIDPVAAVGAFDGVLGVGHGVSSMC